MFFDRNFEFKVVSKEEYDDSVRMFEALDWTWADGKKATYHDMWSEYGTESGMIWFELSNRYGIRFSSLNKSTEFRFRETTYAEFKAWFDDLEKVTCDICGKEVFDIGTAECDGELYCRDCRDMLLMRCADCGAWVHRDDINYVNNGVVCDDCFDDYNYCEGCGAHYRSEYGAWDEDDGCWYCDACYDNIHRAIHEYHYKPDAIFYGDGPLYMGVELEVDGYGEDDKSAGSLCSIMNTPTEKIYCKHDGSLEDGFEIVSHPATLEAHTNQFNWQDLMHEAVQMGYRSHDTRTCGLHVHVSRDALGEDFDEQDATIGRVVYFVERFWTELVKFSRREESRLERWANRCGIERDAKTTYDKAKGNCDRYVAVNLRNDETIEFRIFRGTLRYTTFIATLQLVQAICLKCKDATDKDIERLAWCDFVKGVEGAELIQYLKEKQLYINEEVDAESEEM